MLDSLFPLGYNDSMRNKLPGLHSVFSERGSPLLSTRIIEAQVPLVQETGGRRRIWELHNNFHCSVIGTCLTTGELRHTLGKLDIAGIEKETDHQLHGRAVTLATKRDLGSKVLQKALDKRHRTVINHFAKARTSDEVARMWEQAVRDGDIPGAYWAVLTHPETTEALVKTVFGEVHMLSHLVGAANRADIRRLREQEQRINALEEKARRQEHALQEANKSRVQLVRDLQVSRLERAAQMEKCGDEPVEARENAVLVARLEQEGSKVARLEKRLDVMARELENERRQRGLAESRLQQRSMELDAAERAWSSAFPVLATGERRERGDLDGMTLLYVGGRPNQVAQMRQIAELWNVELLHHDGGVDERVGRLEGYLARAERTLFPVDCVSHNAIAVIKRMAQQSGRTFTPLRSSGLTTFVVALQEIAEARCAAPASV